MTTRLVLLEDRIPAKAKPVYLPGGARSVYVREGSVHLSTDDGEQFVPTGAAAVLTDEVTVTVEEETVLWRWELGTGDDEDHLLRSAPAAECAVKLGMDVDLDPRYRWVMRCDTVTFPPGGVAFTHLHQGPGIRMLHSGEITIETEGTTNVYSPGQCWAEKGVLPVYAPTTPEQGTHFVRCFLLPRHNKGVSSLRVVTAEDRGKINTQSYRILSERVLDTAAGS